MATHLNGGPMDDNRCRCRHIPYEGDLDHDVSLPSRDQSLPSWSRFRKFRNSTDPLSAALRSFVVDLEPLASWMQFTLENRPKKLTAVVFNTSR